MTPTDELVSVRYMVDDVDEAIAFYTDNFEFELGQNASPAFAEVVRGRLRLLLAGPRSSAGRPMPDGVRPAPGGWNRIELVIDDLPAEVARLRTAGAEFRNDIESFLSIEAIRACIEGGVCERRPERVHRYVGFVDVSGGSWRTKAVGASRRASRSGGASRRGRRCHYVAGTARGGR